MFTMPEERKIKLIKLNKRTFNKVQKPTFSLQNGIESDFIEELYRSYVSNKKDTTRVCCRLYTLRPFVAYCGDRRTKGSDGSSSASSGLWYDLGPLFLFTPCRVTLPSQWVFIVTVHGKMLHLVVASLHLRMWKYSKKIRLFYKCMNTLNKNSYLKEHVLKTI